MELDERSTPVNLRGDGLSLQLTYDPRTPSYLVELGSRSLRVIPGGWAPLELGFSSKFTFEKSRLVISALRLSTRGSHADVKGILQDPRKPRGVLNVQAGLSLREVVTMFPVPLDPAGSVDFTGTLKIDLARAADFILSGRADARGAGYSSGRLHVKGAAGRAQVELGADHVTARNIQMDALGAHFTGQLSLVDWEQLHVEGSVDGLTVAEAASIVTPRPIPWNGTLAGTFMADATLGQTATGATAMRASAKLGITPAAAGTPIEGLLDATYDQQESELSLGDSYIATPSTRLNASGALGRRMAVELRSTNLGDLLAALPVLEDNAPGELPLKLNNNGSVAATGTLTGSLDNPRFRGQVTVANASVAVPTASESHSFDKFDADVDHPHGLRFLGNPLHADARGHGRRRNGHGHRPRRKLRRRWDHRTI